MTEELSQDSLRPHEASKDSGAITEGQVSNTTEENALAQSNQNSQLLTAQSNQNNKKYDLGILFVHGIGFQEQGDVFNEIYPAIVNEISLDESVVFEEIPLSSEKEKQVRIIRDGKDSSILFRESYWHGNVENLNHTSGGRSSRLITTLLCLSWCVRILCLKFSQVRVGTPIFFASFVTVISLLFGDNADIIRNLLQAIADRQISRFVIVIAILMIAISCMFLVWLMDIAFVEGEDEKLNEDLSLYDLLLFGRLTKKHLIVFIIYAILSGIYILSGPVSAMAILVLIALLIFLYLYPTFKIFYSKIIGLWNQINTCADYIRSDKDSLYLNRVESDLDDILNESSKVIIVSHSMGEYLSYKVLTQDKYFNLSNVRLVSIGGGLGAVSLIGKSRISDAQGNYSPRKTLGVSSVVAIASISNLGIFIYCWSRLFVDLWSFGSNLQSITHGNFIFLLSDIGGIIISHFLGRGIIYFSGVIDHFSEFKFYRYTHFFDPVGNFSNFVYGLNIVKNITPKLSFGHGVSTYFYGASHRGKPGKVDDFKFMNMKYMQHQLMKHVNESLYVDSRHDYLTENVNRKERWHFRKSTYLLVALVVAVFFEFLGIELGVPLYNLMAKTDYTIQEPFRYMVAFGIFEYWGAGMYYAFISVSCNIFRPGEHKFKFFFFLVTYPLFALIIGFWCVTTWFFCINTLQMVSSVKSLL
ncbi:hypothetical protein [Rothia mucilaginosa]|uniref:hypothetical protein n=1 Tax=Rothia mucilaginosa TaxID=43675 RepID=UPI0028EF0A05|nr:hypothetical protein [Rothia mucilaginosa]